MFYNIKRGSGHLKIDEKSIQNPSKIHAKKKHAKSMENDAKMELKWGPKWIRNSTLAVWGQILRSLNFDEFLKLEKSSKNRKKNGNLELEGWQPGILGGGPAECAGRAEALELCQDLGFLFDTLCPPERGRRIQSASAHSAGPVYGFVSVWCVGLIIFSFCDQISCEKPICGDRFQILFISCKIQPGASKMLLKWSQKGQHGANKGQNEAKRVQH